MGSVRRAIEFAARAPRQAIRILVIVVAVGMLTYMGNTVSPVSHHSWTVNQPNLPGVCANGSRADLNPKSPTYGTAVCA